MSESGGNNGAELMCNVKLCGAKFNLKRNLLAHLRKKHSIDTRICYICSECEVTFSTKAKLKEHVQVEHTIRNFKCENCEAKFATAFQKNVHNQVHKVKEHDGILLYFLSKPGFNKWKMEEEDATNVRFKKITGTANLKRKKATVEYYSCHRSGEYRTRSTGVRNLKTQGSNKLGKKCNAKVTVWTYGDGHVEVVYNPIHSHELDDIRHLWLRQEDRAEIAGMVSAGESKEHILDKFIGTCDGDKISYRQLVSRKNINNVIREYSRGEKLHKGGLMKANKVKQEASSLDERLCKGEQMTANEFTREEFSGGERLCKGEQMTANEFTREEFSSGEILHQGDPIKANEFERVEKQIHELLHIMKSSSNATKVSRMVSDKLEGTVAMAESINKEPETAVPSISQAKIIKLYPWMTPPPKKIRTDFDYTTFEQPETEEQQVLILDDLEVETVIVI